MGERGVLSRSSMTTETSSPQSPGTRPAELPAVSVVVPVLNEAENITPLVQEIMAALQEITVFKVIYVDDGSTDTTPDVLRDLAATIPGFHYVRHRSRAGQSAAVRTGVLTADTPLIATLDGDGQNVPSDIPKLLETYAAEAGDDGRLMIAGWRKGRKDTWTKRMSSKIANGVRSSLLGDQTPDTGCGLKIFRREDFLAFPAFNHMHRFLPALMMRHGGRVISVEVAHRPRQQGTSNYGVFDRLWVGISDLFGVAWLKRRTMKVDLEEPDKGKRNIQ